AMLPQTSPADRRTALFARYNLVASLAGAFGSLAAALPDLLARVGLARPLGVSLIFWLYSACALAVAGLVTQLTANVEAPARSTAAAPGGGWRRRLLPPLGGSRGTVLRLAGLFSIDALAGGLVTQSLLVLYFHLRFGASLSLLSALFFGANLLSALSFLAAVPLARRFGLLNTMVF